MDILIVNNGTKHIKELEDICKSYSLAPTVVSWQSLSDVVITKFDKIILSGSSQFSVPKEPRYADQKKLILETSVPLLGICAGFQLICLAYGSFIVKSPYVISGFMPIRKTHEDSIFPENSSTFGAYEHHRYYCPAVKEPLIPLAMSETGVELIKHEKKPIIGCQFHPEVQDNLNGGAFVLERFLTS